MIKKLLLFAVFAGFAAGVLFIKQVLAPTEYQRFSHKNKTYYAQLAKGCDSLLAQHSMGTNEFVEISVTDPSVPKIISDLHPQIIKAHSKGIWIKSGLGRGFGVMWGPEEWGRTNIWTLRVASGESDIITLYSDIR